MMKLRKKTHFFLKKSERKKKLFTKQNKQNETKTSCMEFNREVLN
jgi:hypothetical protein